MYWFRKHCLHYTFTCSVLCISHSLLKRKKFQKSYQKVCDFIRRLKRCLREGRHLWHKIFLKQYFPLLILSYHVSRNIELTPLLYRTNILFLSAFSTLSPCPRVAKYPGILTHSITLSFFITIVSVNFTLRFFAPLWLKLESCNFYQLFWIHFY